MLEVGSSSDLVPRIYKNRLPWYLYLQLDVLLVFSLVLVTFAGLLRVSWALFLLLCTRSSQSKRMRGGALPPLAASMSNGSAAEITSTAELLSAAGECPGGLLNPNNQAAKVPPPPIVCQPTPTPTTTTTSTSSVAETAIAGGQQPGGQAKTLLPSPGTGGGSPPVG